MGKKYEKPEVEYVILSISEDVATTTPGGVTGTSGDIFDDNDYE